jgi:chemotaxis signal transduction protein
MLNSDDVEPCPSIDDATRSDYIMGVGKQGDRLITVLSLEYLLRVA